MPRLDDESRKYYGFYEKLNIRFEIENSHVYFYETPNEVNMADIFATFDEAKVAAMIAYQRYIDTFVEKLHQTSKALNRITEQAIVGYNPEGGW